MVATQPIRNRKQVRRFAVYYLLIGQLRNYVFILLGLYTALRVSDILLLKWDDVYDFGDGRVREHIYVKEGKTGKSKSVALNGDLVAALTMFAAGNLRRGAPLIMNPRTGNAISRIQAYRITRAAGEALGLQHNVSCHSLRKTFGYHAWMGKTEPLLLMDIYNHSSLAITKRYVGVTQNDLNAVYLMLSFLPLEDPATNIERSGCK